MIANCLNPKGLTEIGPVASPKLPSEVGVTVTPTARLNASAVIILWLEKSFVILIVRRVLLALSVTVFAFNMLGDAMRDLLDPRLKGSR